MKFFCEKNVIFLFGGKKKSFFGEKKTFFSVDKKKSFHSLTHNTLKVNFSQRLPTDGTINDLTSRAAVGAKYG